MVRFRFKAGHTMSAKRREREQFSRTADQEKSFARESIINSIRGEFIRRSGVHGSRLRGAGGGHEGGTPSASGRSEDGKLSPGNLTLIHLNKIIRTRTLDSSGLPNANLLGVRC